MALTLVQRETFQGVGTLNSGTPGNLGTVHASANFYKRPVGPKVSGDSTALGKGWSADMRLSLPSSQGRHVISLSGGAITAGMFSAWYYIDTVNMNGSNKVNLMDQRVGNTNPLLRIGLNPATGKFTQYRNGIWTVTDTVDYPIRTWFELRCQWTTSGSNCTSVSADYRVAGSSTWNSIYVTTSTFNMGGSLVEVRAGSLNDSGSDSYIKGRYGMPSLYTMGSWTDRLDAITDVVDPVAGATSWYVNPATGSDTNDGLTSGTAWATVTKINEESAHCGMFPVTTGYANGDTLTIDTTSANLVLGSSYISINTRGLNIVQLGGGLTGTGEIQAWKAIASNTWSAVGGAPNVYMSNDTDTAAVLWEDDKWMTHILGANIAAATAGLVSTPGSFYTDGTNMYVHPFGDTNPSSDGKVYTRSYYRSNTYSAITFYVPDLRISGLRIRKTCIANNIDHDPGINYCFQGQGAFGGTTLFENCYGDYGSKHVFGFTDNDVNRQVILNNCQAEQGSPYASQTPWVDYSSLSTTGTATTTYNNCITNSGTGLIGSTTGLQTVGAGWVCHNNGSSNYQFAQIVFNNCSINGLFDSYGAVNTIRINGGRCGGGTLRSPDSLISRSRIIGRMFTCDQVGGTTVVKNSIISPEGIAAGNGALVSQGTIDYQGNTIDLRSTSSNGTTVSFFKRFAALTVVWKNNFIIGHATLNITVLQDGVNTDTYTFNNNAYLLGPANKVVEAYNDGSTTSDRTFAQWQALGKDANSFTTTFAAAVASDYKPIKNSPLINAGIDLGPLADYTGVSFLVRNDIGAYEYVSVGGAGLLSSGFRF